MAKFVEMMPMGQEIEESGPKDNKDSSLIDEKEQDSKEDQKREFPQNNLEKSFDQHMLVGKHKLSEALKLIKRGGGYGLIINDISGLRGLELALERIEKGAVHNANGNLTTVVNHISDYNLPPDIVKLLEDAQEEINEADMIWIEERK